MGHPGYAYPGQASLIRAVVRAVPATLALATDGKGAQQVVVVGVLKLYAAGVADRDRRHLLEALIGVLQALVIGVDRRPLLVRQRPRGARANLGLALSTRIASPRPGSPPTLTPLHRKHERWRHDRRPERRRPAGGRGVSAAGWVPAPGGAAGVRPL